MNIFKITAFSALCLLFFSNQCIKVSAVSPLTGTTEERIAAQQSMTIESNEVENWPEGPVVSAEAAILMEAGTGAILYSKNIHEKEYPASTTKILTTLIASEESSLDEIVTFSDTAVFGIPRDSNNIAMNTGDTLTMEECLNAILIRSANEVSIAVAEHIAGSAEDFAVMMNERAAELGCVDSNFVNPNGLPDENHYTSAYDLAMIGRAFFSNEMLCKMTMSPMLIIQKPSGEYRDANQMKLLPGKEYEYSYLVGCKTGYTDAARSTLVSCAEKDGLKLICVVMRDENPEYYEDTISLFDYGFANFSKVNISETETKYNIDNSGAFYSDNDIFGSSKPILSLNEDDYIVLPKTADFSDTVSTISYDTDNENQVALITYTYHDVFIGYASVDLAVSEGSAYSFDTISETEAEEALTEEPSFVFINIFKLLLYIAAIAAIIFLISGIIYVFKNYNFSARSTRRSWRLQQLRRRIPFKSGALRSARRRRNLAKRSRRSHKKGSH
ncbi:MAG: D-alanyl-D-alanine carboxypeptidase [Lachnospiraceae bacterium]|nr:D-alanyl-D-alanine carboxypeptidase [Lachnospiraceae bacterium]